MTVQDEAVQEVQSRNKAKAHEIEKVQNEMNLEDFIVSEKYSPELIMENISLFKNSLEMHLEAGEHLLRQGV